MPIRPLLRRPTRSWQSPDTEGAEIEQVDIRSHAGASVVVPEAADDEDTVSFLYWVGDVGGGVEVCGWERCRWISGILLLRGFEARG